MEEEKIQETEIAKEETKNVGEEESNLLIVAKVVSWFGIILTFVCFITLCFPKTGTYGDREWSSAGIMPTVLVLLATLACTHTMKVLAKISTTLTEIRDKMGK